MLIEEERATYNEDRAKMAEEEVQIRKIMETKNKLIKNKLVNLYDGNLDSAKNLSVDELLDHIAFRLNPV